MSQSDRFVAIDFAPPSAGRRSTRIGAVALAILAFGVLVVGVTQLLLR